MLTDQRNPSGEDFRAASAQTVRESLDRWRQELLDRRVPAEKSSAGYWEGQLSPSALSTATAVSALSAVLIEQSQPAESEQERLRELIGRGVRYLQQSQNADGGFGDTDRSRSNIATTYLVLAAGRLACRALGAQSTAGLMKTESLSEKPLTLPLSPAARGERELSGPLRGRMFGFRIGSEPTALAAGRDATGKSQARREASAYGSRSVQRAESYVERAGGWGGLRRRYGKDKTFVVPILTNCAIAGMVDWKKVSALPFEAAIFPQSMYRFLRMPVVSYAIPALVAIGQARFFLGPKPLPPVRWIRSAAVNRTMHVLREMQPESGGYLEATPLTSFVLMSLAATNRGGCEVAQACIRFLSDSVLEDGSWPIDTNLAAFVTSLAVHALRTDPDDDASWMSDGLIDWHLGCQHTARHPFTGADPGGWGWTDLSGAVPDGDDTPGAILALHAYREARIASPEAVAGGRGAGGASRIDRAAEAGCDWLLRLQNRDGGWPTFCRGWGKLPFDRSSVDLTAHALRALKRQSDELGVAAAERSLARGWRYLEKSQRPDGSWLPLWFGNHDLENDENPFYGTGRVLLAIGDAGNPDAPMAQRACAYLIDRQNADGGWGGGPTLTDWLEKRGLEAEDREIGVKISSSVEETAVVLEGLAAICEIQQHNRGDARFGTVGGSGGAIERALGSESVFENHRSVGGESRLRAAILFGSRFLDQAIQHDRHRTPWPIGFYFAKLWYHERLYPAVFATAALARVLKSLRSHDTGSREASLRTTRREIANE